MRLHCIKFLLLSLSACTPNLNLPVFDQNRADVFGDSHLAQAHKKPLGILGMCSAHERCYNVASLIG